MISKYRSSPDLHSQSEFIPVFESSPSNYFRFVRTQKINDFYCILYCILYNLNVRNISHIANVSGLPP